MGPLEVAVVRNGVEEALHRVQAVAVEGGNVVQAAGDPASVSYFRSSAKPIQALPVVRSRPDLDSREIAIACASHLHRPDQLAPVRSLLAKAPASEDDLECGAEPTRIEHNCSGKHAAMLALCRARGWPTQGYRLLGHPCQQAMLAEVADAAEVAAETIPTGVDGCGVPTFALSLRQIAHAFARFPVLEGGDLAAAAMRAHPELVRGPGSPDTTLMESLPGWVAKGGAEGLLCATREDGLGVALKVEDGSWRPQRPALAAFLERLGIETGALGVVPVTSSRGEVVGELVVR